MTDDILRPDRRDLLKIGAAALLAVSAPGFALAQPAAGKVKIGVIGGGHIGGTIGGLWVKAGHQVLFSSRHPEELKSLVDRPRPARQGRHGRRSARFRRGDPGGGALQGDPRSRQGVRAEVRRQDRDGSGQRGGAPRRRGVARRDQAERHRQHHGVLSEGLACGAGVQLDGLRQLRQAGAPRRRPDGDPDRGRRQARGRGGFATGARCRLRAGRRADAARQEFAQGGPIYGQQLTAKELRERFGLAK